MPLFAGMERTDYQDILRAIGRLMDAEGFRNFRIIEQEDGIVLQAVRYGQRTRNFETYLLTEEDVQAILRNAYQLRGTGQSLPPKSSAP